MRWEAAGRWMLLSFTLGICYRSSACFGFSRRGSSLIFIPLGIPGFSYVFPPGLAVSHGAIPAAYGDGNPKKSC